MFISGKTAEPDLIVNRRLERANKTAEELRLEGVNAIGIYETKIVAYYNFSFRDASVDKIEVLYSEKAGA